MITDEKLAEIREGLEGVTPGPWRAAQSWRPPLKPELHKSDDFDANRNVFWGYSIAGSNENGAHIYPTLASVHNFPNNIHSTAAHRARCDPDPIRALISRLEAAETARADALNRLRKCAIASGTDAEYADEMVRGILARAALSLTEKKP